MKKPLIGISCGISERIVSKINQRFFQELSSTYTRAVAESGGIPVIIPNDLSEDVLKELAQRMDGFLFSGGEDVDPKRYGKEDRYHQAFISEKRDETELTLLKHVLNETDKPVFAICRGLQVLNVAMGGTLIIDLPSAGKDEHSLRQFPREKFSHEITVKEGSRLKDIMKDETRVNSFHHQAIDEAAEGLVVTAYSLNDHVIEAAEAPGERFILGVQWHPEELIAHQAHKRLFETFISEAERNR